MICNEKLSFKKINGKSNIALNWGKNLTEGKKEKFMENIMIINLKSEQWWKNGPKGMSNDIDFTKQIPAGIYIIDKYYCKNNVVLSSNNKTDTLINSKYLYMMLRHSKRHHLYLPLPSEDKQYKFDILSAFIE